MDTAEYTRQSLQATVDVATEILDGYDAALDTLDDDTVNDSPFPGTVNSAFGLVTHVHGLSFYWCGTLIAGEEYQRDRDAEFLATGTVDEAHALVAEVRERFSGWAQMAASEGIRGSRTPTPGTTRRDVSGVSAAWALDHVLHEAAQHLGHLEVCRDMVTRAL